jgi:magnesium transporter
MLLFYKKNDIDDDFERIDNPVPGCWIHVDNASIDDIRYIATLVDLDQTDLQDALDKYEIPRIEKIDKTTLVFARHPITKRESGLFTITFAIILSEKYFITLCPGNSTLVENFLNQTPKISIQQSSKFLLYILLKITQSFTLNIKRIRTSVLKQEKEIDHIESEDITSLTVNEENLNQYLATLIPLRNVLESLTSGKYFALLEKEEDLLEDLLNASIQSEDLCSTNLRSIRSLRDSYQIIFTNQLNKTIRLLTALTIILSLPTMIASLYGMNVSLPFSSSSYSFIFILIFIFMVGSMAYWIFQRKRWL